MGIKSVWHEVDGKIDVFLKVDVSKKGKGKSMEQTYPYYRKEIIRKIISAGGTLQRQSVIFLVQLVWKQTPRELKR